MRDPDRNMPLDAATRRRNVVVAIGIIVGFVALVAFGLYRGY